MRYGLLNTLRCYFERIMFIILCNIGTFFPLLLLLGLVIGYLSVSTSAAGVEIISERQLLVQAFLFFGWLGTSAKMYSLFNTVRGYGGRRPTALIVSLFWKTLSLWLLFAALFIQRLNIYFLDRQIISTDVVYAVFIAASIMLLADGWLFGFGTSPKRKWLGQRVRSWPMPLSWLSDGEMVGPRNSKRKR